jgi:glycosyltransferase involved in cell wall biosynthesis
MKKKLRILGIRGLPANHGGFETFAEHLALYLVKRAWKVTVYCQEEEKAGGDGKYYNDNWRGVHLVHIPVKQKGALATVVFDWKSVVHASREPGLILTLGYNTALFNILYRLKGLINIINMDGIEWRRQKWGAVAKAWLYINERAAVWLGNHLVADHPEIKKHLSTRIRPEKITTITYGSHRIEQAEVQTLGKFGLTPNGYAILIARPEPENSILEVVRVWSRKKRGVHLLILGSYNEDHAYHRMVTEASSKEVIFAGAIYDAETVAALRFFARFYIHGHQVGGTNPSLVEALGAGNSVFAHDNPFNRWVAGDGACYFSDEESFEKLLDQVLHDEKHFIRTRLSSLKRHAEAFSWKQVLSEYENLFLSHLPLQAGIANLAPVPPPTLAHEAFDAKPIVVPLKQNGSDEEGLEMHLMERRMTQRRMTQRRMTQRRDLVVY